MYKVNVLNLTDIRHVFLQVLAQVSMYYLYVEQILKIHPPNTEYLNKQKSSRWLNYYITANTQTHVLYEINSYTDGFEAY